MPIYEYVCEKCGKKTEVIQRIGEKPLKVCPHCSGRLKKAISAPAIQFKGSGFYITDYRSNSYKDAAKNDSSPGGEKKADTKSETKPETRAETKSEAKAPAAKTESKPAAPAKKK